MRSRADGVRVAYPLFQVDGDGSKPISALDMRFEVIDRQTMEDLNREWHSRLPEFRTACKCRVYYGAECGGLWYAVAAWSHPVARLLPQSWMELRRLAIADDAPKNTATRMLGWMVRDIKKRFPDVERLISYQDTEVHTGCIYAGAGWKKTKRSEGDEWNRPNRFRDVVQSSAPKQRWELEITRQAIKMTEVKS